MPLKNIRYPEVWQQLLFTNMNFFPKSTSIIILYGHNKVCNPILWSRNKLQYPTTGGKKKVIQISTEERSGLLLIYTCIEKLKKKINMGE